ncbi:ATP-binding protein [Bradyrhizobium liaoningense]|uniref:sensor histidine kinase n=1 Tax=Bradyrhizobium liaoningense TaxID=43992 RepID=UPI001BAB8AA1|nr:sensor histidine kinase [Bradyrhizobium liaoningense]MBR0841326.1 ATP-binding protein [Bradyrhizobium liaoningense]
MAVAVRKKGRSEKLVFRVRPRLLTLLGDQLIKDANLAVFELVKNAYDADATVCAVTLEHPTDQSKARIIVEDDGVGMDEDTLRDVWMMIATDFRALQRKEDRRTKKFNRFPLGEKGLGRLSAHKLGRSIRLITRRRGGNELVLDFDWDKIESAEDLESAGIELEVRDPETFTGNGHGTCFEITRLRETWNRGQARRLHRAVNSLCSPFKGPEDFEVMLSIPEHAEWLENLFSADKANSCALYHVRGSFEGTTGRFDYTFTPPPGYSKQLTKRTEKGSKVALEKREDKKTRPLDLSGHDIGTVSFDFWLFDRDPAVLRDVTDDVKGLKDYLDENGGIRIYRDGIRVYDFGEPGNDWLNLDIRRVNTPTARTSNNQILGALRLDATESGDLREKTNREGFIENEAFEDFRAAVLNMLTQVEAEKTKDQRRLREVLGKGTGKRVFAKLAEVREVLEKKGTLAEVEPILKAAEKEMEIYRDQLLHAAVPGLSIGMMLHGAEKILDELRAATNKGASAEKIKDLVDQLYRAMRPVTNLLKNPHPGKTSASALIREAIFSAEFRLKRHHITLINGMDQDCPDFKVEGSKQMLVASINNLIDNSIHWLETRDPKQKFIYIGTTKDIEEGPAIVVGDNGPGFGKDDPEDLIAPFFTRRSGGMGLGLYIVSEVMRVNRGRIVFPSDGDVELPKQISGAVVALQFLETS